ncbi:hypothetical protein QVD99_007445 [Batrachochytrium dendrobatidis]|nr:hypothetical protein O5D80_008394 [Batrachochytrium dendrobatidis]KAK5665816.1 hypothetical protein QVD99_007445 [Batrachochytrium dendrobatidis]
MPELSSSLQHPTAAIAMQTKRRPMSVFYYASPSTGTDRFIPTVSAGFTEWGRSATHPSNNSQPYEHPHEPSTPVDSASTSVGLTTSPTNINAQELWPNPKIPTQQQLNAKLRSGQGYSRAATVASILPFSHTAKAPKVDPLLELVNDVFSRRREFQSSVQALQNHMSNANPQHSPALSNTTTELRTRPAIPSQNTGFAQNLDTDEDPEKITLQSLISLNERLKQQVGRALSQEDCNHDYTESSRNPALDELNEEEVSLLNPLVHSNKNSSIFSTVYSKAAKIGHRCWFYVCTDKAFRFAFQVSIAIVLATLFNFVDVLRDQIHGKGWAAVTVIATYEATYGGFLRKSLQRVIGTVFGGLIGVALLAITFALPPFCLQCSYKPYLLSISLFVATFIISYARVIQPKYSYVYMVMLLTVLIVVLGEYAEPNYEEDWDPSLPFYSRPFYVSAVNRIGLVVLGVAISFVVSTFVMSERASTRLPERVGKIMTMIAELQEFVHLSYHDGTKEVDFSITVFRDEALVKADGIAKELEKLRVLIEDASGEILLTSSEAKAVSHSPDCQRGVERLFYLTVTMVYGRIWAADNIALHQILDTRFHVLIEMLGTVIHSTSRVFQHRLIDPTAHNHDPQLLSTNIFPLLRDAVFMTLCLFRQEQTQLHQSNLAGAFSEMEWANWNHYSLSFMQCLVNLGAVIEAGALIMAKE